MSTTRQRTVRVGWACAAMLSLAVGTDIMQCLRHARGDGCESHDPGCVESVTVPCSNATCAVMSSYPSPPPGEEPPLLICDDLANYPTRFSATAVTSWLNCVSNGISPGKCKNDHKKCADITLYRATPCNMSTECATRTLHRCGNDTSPPPDCPGDP